jgi:uncharacterized membrane protein
MAGSSEKYFRWLVIIAIILHFSIFLLLGLSRHWGYMSSINDLGVFDQAVWSVLHEKYLLNTSQLNQPINWLGFHFQPILFLFVPFYKLFPNVIWFTIAQALALSIAGWPIFLLASSVFQSEKIGLFWSLIYLTNPFLLNAAAWDFHPITLAVPFVAIGMLAIEMEKFRLLFFSTLFVLLCQEHFGIMVVGFGLLWWIRNNRWKTGISLILIGISHFVLVLGVIMPEFSPSGEHIMLNDGVGQLNRYGWLGTSLNEVSLTLLFHPIYVIKTILIEFKGASYLLCLMIFIWGYPIAAPAYLLPGLADLFANLLSANPMPKDFFSYHSVSLVPILTVAALFGAKRLTLLTTKFSSAELTGFAVVASCFGGYLLAPFPLPGARNVWAPVHFLNMPEPTVHTIRSVVGEKSSVSAQGNIGTHFSQRQEIYYYPNKVGYVDVVILRLKSPTLNISIPHGFQLNHQKYLSMSGFHHMLDGHLLMDRTEYIASIEHLLANKEYGILIWEDPWLVFKRGIVQKLDQLRKDWKVE